jgi:uncharacterized delta-60 repeat protein
MRVTADILKMFWNRLYETGFLLVLLLFVIGISSTAMAAFPSLDPAFGTGGKVLWSPNGNTESRFGSAMALQSDGKVVMAGGYSDTAAPLFMIVRFNADGSLDTSFGSSGVTVVTFGGINESAKSVAIQPDGKIVAAGVTTLPGVGNDDAIARLNSDGSLDTTFSGDGKVTVGFTVSQSAAPDYVNAVKIAGGGKIVFAGGSGPGPSILYYSNVGRLNSDGSLDSSFGDGGRVINGLGSGIYQDLIPNADGSIYAAGSASAQFSSVIMVTKYNDNGTAAWTYSKSIQPGCYMNLNAMAAQTDGKLVVVGSDNCRMSAIRINTNGTLDSTFNAPVINDSMQSFAVAVQPDGKILANITFQSNNNDGFSLVRYNTNGSLDTGFGTAGFARIRVINSSEIAHNVILQPDGKILLGGSATTTGYRFAMARLIPRRPLFDFDGDGKSDVSIFRPSESNWYLNRSTDGLSVQNFGLNGDILTPGDFDGDGKTDLVIWRPSTGTWWYKSTVNGAFYPVQFGANGDIPLAEDFNGDGRADFVIFRPSTSSWYRLGSNGEYASINFGTTGDIPLVADMDGDGKADPTVYRPSTGTWWYASSANGQFYALQWGTAADIPVPGDYDGDGKTDPAYFRPSSGTWLIAYSSTGYTSFESTAWGLAGDRPVAADYDGDGKTDIAIYRPSNGMWFAMRSTSGFFSQQFGLTGDQPVPASFIP